MSAVTLELMDPDRGRHAVLGVGRDHGPALVRILVLVHPIRARIPVTQADDDARDKAAFADKRDRQCADSISWPRRDRRPAMAVAGSPGDDRHGGDRGASLTRRRQKLSIPAVLPLMPPTRLGPRPGRRMATRTIPREHEAQARVALAALRDAARPATCRRSSGRGVIGAPQVSRSAWLRSPSSADSFGSIAAAMRACPSALGCKGGSGGVSSGSRNSDAVQRTIAQEHAADIQPGPPPDRHRCHTGRPARG